MAGSKDLRSSRIEIDHPVFLSGNSPPPSWDMMVDGAGSAASSGLADGIDNMAAQRREMARRVLHFMDLTESCWSGHAPFGPQLNILVDMYLKETEGRVVTVGDACIASRVPHTTGLRVVENLVQQDMLIRYPDPFDSRRRLLSLTPQSRNKVTDYLNGLLTRFGLLVQSGQA